MTLSPQKGLRVGLWGLIGLIGLIGLMGLMGLISLTGEPYGYPLCLCPAIYSKGANHQSNMAAPFCDFGKSQPTKMEMAILPRQT